MIAGKATSFGQASESRHNNFDFLRLLLATLVIYSHSFPLLLGARNRDILWRITGGQMDFGDVAVNAFFVISGFLITGSWLRSRGWWDYLKKRMLRIYPGFAVASLFCTLVVGPLGAPQLSAYLSGLDPQRIIRHIATLTYPHQPGDVFIGLTYPTLNGSMWTIRYEFWCYLLVAVCGLLGMFRWRAVALALASAALLAFAFQGYDVLNRAPDQGVTGLEQALGDYYHWPRFLAFFLVGMSFYLYRDVIPYTRKLFTLSLIVLAVSAWKGMAFALPVFGTYALFYVAFQPSLQLQRFTRKGDFSYGLYLYGFPVQQLLIFYGGKALSPHALFILAFVTTLGLAALSWHFVEKPFLKKKGASRPADRRDAVAPGAGASARRREIGDRVEVGG
jgi:peptidoglycan/LPS O-acetylase OafA/YrhL